MKDEKILEEEILSEDELEQVAGGKGHGSGCGNLYNGEYAREQEEKRKKEEREKAEQAIFNYVLSQPEVKDFLNNLWQKMNGK